MEKNKSKLPNFNSLDKLVAFFDSNDMGEYLNTTSEIDFDVDIKKRTHLVSLDVKLADELQKIAKSKHITSKKLINKWLKEKVQQF